MVGIIKEILVVTCVPILVLSAWNQWKRDSRVALSQWRNGIALASLLILSATWMIAMLIDIPELLHIDPKIPSPDNIRWFGYLMSHLFDIIAIGCAFMLRRKARIKTIVAGILLLVCWPGGYI